MVSVETNHYFVYKGLGSLSKSYACPLKKIEKGVRVMDLGPSHERMNILFENGKVLAFTVAFQRL